MSSGFGRGRALRLLGAVLLASGLVALAGCGGRDDEGGGGAGGDLSEVPGFDGETITLGVQSALSGPVAVIGKPLTNGNEVWFDYINEQGGIAGEYQVELEVTDNRYNPQTAVQQYQGAKDEVVMFTQVLGTPITTAVLPQLRTDNVVASPASLDSLWVREQNLAPLGGPYQIQAINGMDYYVNELGSQDDTVCTMVSDDTYGEAGQEGVEFAAEELGFEIAETATFRIGDQDFAAQIGQLKQANCDVVWFTGLPTEAGAIYGTAAQADFAPTWLAQSPSWVDELLDSPLREYLEQSVYIMGEGPQWGDRSVQGMADMLDRIEQYAPRQEPDFYFTYGYNQGRLITEILEQAVENGDLSREGIIQAMEDLDTVSFDGLSGDYQYGGVDSREPPSTSTVFKVSGDAPFGLQAEAVDRSSEPAEAFEFESE
jgi:ABC-type branched-subunit amino acid transport system substrate-binding protein